MERASGMSLLGLGLLYGDQRTRAPWPSGTVAIQTKRNQLLKGLNLELVCLSSLLLMISRKAC